MPASPDFECTLTATDVLDAVKAQPGFLTENTHDPLRNSTQPLTETWYRTLTTVLILPLALARVVLFLVVFVGTGCTSQFAACFPRGFIRHSIMSLCMYGVRAGLFFLGFHWVSEKGEPAKRSEAAVVVTNHVSFVEAFYLTSKLHACGMAEQGLADIPMVRARRGKESDDGPSTSVEPGDFARCEFERN